MRTDTILRVVVAAAIVIGIFQLVRYKGLDYEGSKDFLNGLVPGSSSGSESDSYDYEASATYSAKPASETASSSSNEQEKEQEKEQQQEQEQEKGPVPNFKSAGNATLGFEKLFYINLPSRFDCADVMAMQQDICGLDIEYVDGIDAHTITEKGLPPSSNFLSQMNLGRLGCWRSHASIWQRMLAEKWQTVMVLESDATWDVNIRNITERLAEGLHHLIQDPKFNLARTKNIPTENDPYNSAEWDYLAIGACMESDRDARIYYKFPDSDSPDAEYSFDGEVFDTVKNERIIRKSGGPICTNAYAVSRTGARKMLLRSAVDLDTAVDLMINELVREGDMISYTPFPPLVYQWNYRGGIVPESHNSDITEKEEGEKEKTWTDDEKKQWKDARKHHNVWSLNGMFHRYPFKHWVIDYFSPNAFPHLYDPVQLAAKEKAQEIYEKEKEKKKKAKAEKEKAEKAEKEKAEKEKAEKEKAEKEKAESEKAESAKI